MVKVVFLEMFHILLKLIKRRDENCCGQSAVYNPIEIFLSLSFSLQLSISENNFITMFRLISFYFLLENIRGYCFFTCNLILIFSFSSRYCYSIQQRSKL